MITEDYVSFETAKLLKEKGFDEITFTWYAGKGKFCVGKNNFDDYHVNHLSNMASAIDKNKCSAPTLQMAMKWLRKIHNIFVTITMYLKEGIELFHYELLEPYDNHIDTLYSEDGLRTYEEACEAAIKYCLENLI